MDHKPIFDQFKNQYIEPGGVFPFNLFSVLFLELRNYGVSQEDITEQFAKDFIEMFLSNEKTGLKLKAIQYMNHYSDLLPKLTVLKQTAIKTAGDAPATVHVEDKVVQTKNVVTQQVNDDHIPTEEEEGDPLFTPEDQKINLKPEDCAPKQYDWEFVRRIGVVGLEE